MILRRTLTLALGASALNLSPFAPPPPKAAAGSGPAWLQALLAPPEAQSLLIREADGIRVRHGLAADAPRIRELWSANDDRSAPHQLGRAWSPEGITTAFARRRRASGATAATSTVAYRENSLVGFLAATSAEEAFNNVGPLVAWRDLFEEGVPRALFGPVCVCASARGTGLFRDLYRALLVESADLDRVREGVVIIDARNEPSLRAHRKLRGCGAAGEFESADGRPWVVLKLDLEQTRAGLAEAA